MNSPFNKLITDAYEGTTVLSFSLNNSKLKKTKTAAFSLPSGFTCPGACDCLSWFDREERQLKDGPQTEFRCFSASLEAAFKNRQELVDRNLAILKQAKTSARMAEVIDQSLPALNYPNIRVHDAGDFFNQAYFLAWMRVAEENQNRLFYAYTKSLPIWVKNREAIPGNFVLTASMGGKWDSLIEPNGLRYAKVVYHPDEAEELGLPIDHDDSHARDPEVGNFALLLHGQQPKGSDASRALKRLRTEKIPYSYGRKTTKTNVSSDGVL